MAINKIKLISQKNPNLREFKNFKKKNELI